jgi:hypothetical protein
MQYTHHRFYAMLTTRFWGVTTGVLCALLLQNCQSPLNALEEESPAEVLPQSGCQPLASEALTQPLGYLPSPTRAMHQPKVPPTAFAGASPSTGIRPAASTTRSRNIFVQDSCRPLTASTGELVHFQQVGSQWQAVLQGGAGAYAHKRTLPVVSAEEIGVFLARLQGQDVWVSRSRIHVLATPTPPYSPCVYVGKLGLLGGMPAQQVPLAAAGEWLPGPHLILGSGAADKAVYYIPPGYRYKGYRTKESSVIQRASCTIYYVAADNEQEMHRLVSAQDGHTAGARLGVDVGKVIPIGTLEGGIVASPPVSHQDFHTERTQHAALVVCGKTKKNKLLCAKSSINLEIEILVEKTQENLSSPHAFNQTLRAAERKKLKAAQAQLQREAQLAAEERERALFRQEYEHLLSQQQEFQTPSQVALQSKIADLEKQAFGAQEWEKYFGDVGSAPDLPSDMATILDGPCPFWPDQLVKDTHLLVLIPATVGGVPLTLNLLGELIQHPSHGGHRTEYRYYHGRVKSQIGKESPPRSYWLLMTRDVLPGSRRKVYAHQKELVVGYARRESAPYKLLSVLEAATAILMHHAREGERLFGDCPLTFTRCPAVVDGSYPAVVGGFESSGLDVDYIRYSSHHLGVACCRRF